MKQEAWVKESFPPLVSGFKVPYSKADDANGVLMVTNSFCNSSFSSPGASWRFSPAHEERTQAFALLINRRR